MKITAFAVLHSENKQNHMSDDYQTEQVVLRRGFDALMTFQLSDELDPDRHSLAIHFNCGTRPSYSRHTHFVSRIGVKPTRSYHWSGSVVLTERTSVEVAVKVCLPGLPLRGGVGWGGCCLLLINGFPLRKSSCHIYFANKH